MKGWTYVGALLGFIYLCAALSPVAIQYSENKCVRSINPYDPLHDFLPCVKPGNSFWVTVTLNSSTALTNVLLNQNETLCTPNCISGLTNVEVGSFSANTPKRVNLTLTAPEAPGLYQPLIVLTSDAFEVSTFYLRIEVTCSNGIFCDGLERWSNGKCVSGADPCDDGFACTQDVCTESAQLCTHLPDGPDCANCGECDKTCAEAGTLCGINDCEENCGECDTLLGDICLPDIGCRNESTVMGTCTNPIVLFSDGFELGLNTFTDTTADGPALIAPSCAPYSKAPEKIYSLTVNGTYFVDVRIYGAFDTILSAFLINSCGPTVYQSCNDDSSPPGELGSRVTAKLVTGTYYFLVDGYSSQDFGEFTMEFRISATCAPSCAGKFCGNDLCGGDCGPCGDGLTCSAFRCVSEFCVPACNTTRSCGIGECGEDCGSCPSDRMCVQSTGECVPYPSCNHLVPVCTPECGDGQFCASDCTCYALDFPLPDLVITKPFLERTISFTTETFGESHCAIVEHCLSRPGKHRLLRFGVEALNQGKGPIAGKDPADNPQLYEWSPCHSHYHFQQFSEYFLLSADGKVVKEGRKQAYCLRDSLRALKSPSTPCKSRHDCENQGINAGWSDIYGPTLDCQWLEVNDIEPGDYVLFISVNPGRIIAESNFENNGVYLPLTITATHLGLNVTTPAPVAATPITSVPIGTPPIAPTTMPIATPRPVRTTSLGAQLQIGFGLCVSLAMAVFL